MSKAIAILLSGIFIWFGLRSVSGSINHYTEIYEQRERANLSQKMIEMAPRICNGGSQYNTYTGFFTCK